MPLKPEEGGGETVFIFLVPEVTYPLPPPDRDWKRGSRPELSMYSRSGNLNLLVHK
jgi:hypothetical protein